MKKNIWKLYIILVFYVLFHSCQFKNAEEKSIIQIVKSDMYIIDLDKQQPQRSIFISDIFKKVKIIPLETTEESLISSLDIMQVHNDMIYIFDSKLKRLSVFNSNGEFQGTIGRIGGGPGEYSNLRDFTIDTENNEIYLLDGMSKKIYKYRLSDGQFINSINIIADNHRVSYIQYKDGKMYYDLVPYEVSGKDTYMLQRLDIKTNEIDGSLVNSFDYNKGWNGPISRRGSFFFSRTSGNPKFIPKFADIVLAITKNDISPVLAVHSKEWIRQSDVNKFLETYIVDGKFDPIIPILDKKANDIHNYIEYKDIIMFEYVHEKHLRTVVFNKKTNSTTTAECILDNVTYKKEVLSSSFICNDEKGVYAYLSTKMIPFFIENVINGNLSSDIRNIEKLKMLTSESNPIIFYYE